MSSSTSKCSVRQLENIDENAPAVWHASSCAPPDTPTESMEFLARSWSLSAMELSKALHNTNITTSTAGIEMPLSSPVGDELYTKGSTASKDSLPNGCCPPISPKDSDDTKDLFLLHQALNPEFLSSQNLLRNGLYRSLLRGRTMGRWLKDQKERKKQEIRTHNAQLHAAVSVAGVAAAVAAAAASTASLEMPNANQKNPPMSSAAIASAAALVASHCVEIAEDMGAEHDQIITIVNSAINAKTNGDIMTLTAGAATDIITGICNDIPAWPGREKEDISEKRAYFGIKTADRIIEFECGSKGDKQCWLEGIQYMLNCRAKVT